ncbi:MAG: ABC transporter ATP-binding protein, partial [Mesorhizobium sp.]
MPAISPSSGEIRCHRRLRKTTNATRMAEAAKLPISPLEGEMSGRTEGGA